MTDRFDGICPDCREGGLTSRVTVGPSTVTCMAGQQFYDEQGRFHDHDPNTMTTQYSCSNGHVWSSQQLMSCRVCEEDRVT